MDSHRNVSFNLIYLIDIICLTDIICKYVAFYNRLKEDKIIFRQNK